ncbi:MAG: hypothetical protein LBK71_09225, partial [Verrucomicrobiales bacterium]|nr:hypothetical protein [Verrucomicrobiales bacterium]
MKHHLISNWAALLLTISGMAALPLTTTAEVKIINTATAVVETGSAYTAVTGTNALYVASPGASYTGTGVLLTSTLTSLGTTMDHNRYVAQINDQGALALFSSTVINSGTPAGSGDQKGGIYIGGTSTGYLENVTVWVLGMYQNNPVRVADFSTLTVRGGSYTLGAFDRSNATHVFHIEGSSVATLENVNVRNEGVNGYGIAADRSTVFIIGGTVTTVGGGNSWGVSANYSELWLEHTVINALGNNAIGIRSANNSMYHLDGVAITVSSANPNAGIYLESGGSVDGTGVTIDSVSYGVYSNHGASLNLTDSSITTSGTRAVLEILLNSGSDTNMVFTGGTLARTEDGNLLHLTGTAGAINVTFNGVDLTNGGDIVTGTNNATVNTVSMTGDSDWHGDVVVSHTSTLTLDLDHSAMTGNIDASDNAVITVTSSNGTTSTGTVSGNDHAIIDLTVSGSHSALFGDIAQHDHAVVTITIDNGATSSGGYHGGNLITGADSAWTFNKDSHVNNGINHGTFNIGDHEVTFDNLTNTGTLTISVNSDTGAGGTIITGTADGEGTVHIDTTGNGKLNPNDVLPGKVTGDGTEHWQWDPINWGIDTIVKDGDHFIKQGTSPAGAVLNSSVAIQQAMWFAQQNSLLKR